ncbi:MFS transporter [Periweissella ghanensis]|uniref:Staphylopine export protein n=1 Tax=Periweissella ghanensis TaxID=467997 RepID=A0ABM8ZAN5_9LACO|nr:MFS transporter [Periweissella ghanensis]MCM0601125.1 MFS transporter [Periweissella ghanensis]CAH0417792.1 Staphylopine export protein [Periweissella ghanensis]
MEEEEHLFNKNFISVTVINFVVYLVYYLLIVIIAVIAQKHLHASLAEAGLASGIYIIGTLFARLLIGKKLEILGRKNVLRYGGLAYLITTAAYLYMPNLAILFAIRLLNGFCYGMVSTATNAIVTEYIPFSKRGEGINYYGLSTSLAAAFGPLIGLLLLTYTNFYTIIIISIILIVLSTLGSFILPVKEIEVNPDHLATMKSWKLNTFMERKVLFISFIGLLMGLAYSSVLSFLASYAEAIHLVQVSSFFFLVYAGAVTLTRPMSGKMFDRFGEDSVMYPSYIFLTLGLFALSFTTVGWQLLGSGVLVGLGYGTFMSNGQAVVLKTLRTESHKIGLGLSTYFIGLDLGIGIGPYILGELKNFISFQEMYLVAGILPLVCAVLYKIYYNPSKVTKGIEQEIHHLTEHAQHGKVAK